jgi:hypothetical protein
MSKARIFTKKDWRRYLVDYNEYRTPRIKAILKKAFKRNGNICVVKGPLYENEMSKV